jgi:riboflavin synthase
MFTGIIEELGAVVSLMPRASGALLAVRCSTVMEDMTLGASIAVNGVCLTATELRPDGFTADVASESLSRSNLGELRPGARVNLERALTPASRMGGHIVLGHVDATGEFLSLAPQGAGDWWLRVRFPAELDPYLVFKGSIAIDGVSLTIATMDAGALSASVIPHTAANTSFAGYRSGQRVNLECDILAKHVAKLLGKLDVKEPLSISKLIENGY